MGVPGFYRKLIQKHKHIVRKDTNEPIDSLYIDANCLFHPECFKVLEYYPDCTDPIKLFKLMKNRILTKLDHLISISSPSNLVYIAVDGTCPLAKILQQRMRRFGYAKNYKAEIYNKHNIKINDSWSNIVITPATDFMYDLHNEIINHYKSTKKNRKYTIIYDSYMTVGEGEHKILQHIKSRKDISKNKSYIIYGLDADLIFLAMSSQIDNIYLLREADQFGMVNKNRHEDEQDAMLYADINYTKECINLEYNEHYQQSITMGELFTGEDDDDETIIPEKINFVNDYIFICYFLGNDFLPHLPSIDIKINGMDIVKRSYIECFSKYHTNLINYDTNNDIIINHQFLVDFIKIIGDEESQYFKYSLPNHMHRHKKKRCFENTPHKKEIWNIENLKNIKINDPIMLGHGDKNDYKKRYYKHYFKSDTYHKENVNNICHNYIEGLVWVCKYYFNKCPDWQWQYKYTHAPFLSDLYHYLKNKNIATDFNTQYNEPLNIYEHLVSVIPYKYNHILPKKLRHLSSSCDSKLIDMFPLNYDIDIKHNYINVYQFFHI
jgi:5'-3' exonuclease